MKKRDLEGRDCKPSNYNYVSSNLKFNKAFNGRESILKSLEQLLLKSLLTLPPDEKLESIELIRTFEGKRRTTFWFSELRKQKALANQLLRACRVKYN